MTLRRAVRARYEEVGGTVHDAGGRVLLYDDDPESGSALADALAAAGLDVVHVAPPVRLESLAGRSFDVGVVARGHLTLEVKALFDRSCPPRAWIRLRDPGERVSQDEHRCFVGSTVRTRPEAVVLTVQVVLRAIRTKAAPPVSER